MAKFPGTSDPNTLRVSYGDVVPEAPFTKGKYVNFGWLAGGEKGSLSPKGRTFDESVEENYKNL